MAHIKLVTELPGPKSREMAARHERFVARGLAFGFPAFIREAEGAMLTDMHGNRLVKSKDWRESWNLELCLFQGCMLLFGTFAIEIGTIHGGR